MCVVVCLQGKVEGSCLALIQEIQTALDTLSEDSSCLLDPEALRTTRELIQVCVCVCVCVCVFIRSHH